MALVRSSSSSPASALSTYHISYLISRIFSLAGSEDKADHAQLAARLASRTNCAVAVPNYRLSPHVQHPQHAHDILRALTFLIGVPLPGTDTDANISAGVDELPERGTVYDPTRLFLVGHSCGAHIISSIFLHPLAPSSSTTLSGFTHSSTILTPPPSLLTATRAIALSEGLYDIDALIRSFPTYQSWFVEQAFGHPPPYPSVSPVHYGLYHDASANNDAKANSDYGPGQRWLIIHSPADTLVDLYQSEVFFDHLMSLYRDRDRDQKRGLEDKDNESVKYVDKDWSTLTTEHNQMLKTEQYSDLVGDWLVKHK